uniref:Uncharacterized protein n=1 Tax=Ixodes ricinus TaxID=34613 RepID=A0A6B0UK99_IXORI
MRWMLQCLGHLSKKLLLIQPWTTTASASLSRPQNQRVLMLAAKQIRPRHPSRAEALVFKQNPRFVIWAARQTAPGAQRGHPFKCRLREQHKLSDDSTRRLRSGGLLYLPKKR